MSGVDSFDGASVRRVGLISDTHGRLRAAVFDRLAGVDVILHAGDIGPAEILTELETIAPVFAVQGNTDDFDTRAIAPEQVDVTLGGRRFTIVHGHIIGTPSPRSLRLAHPDCDVIVYGHTHRALTDDSREPLVINPGAAGPARFDLKPSVAVLDLESMRVEVLPLA